MHWSWYDQPHIASSHLWLTAIQLQGRNAAVEAAFRPTSSGKAKKLGGMASLLFQQLALTDHLPQKDALVIQSCTLAA